MKQTQVKKKISPLHDPSRPQSPAEQGVPALQGGVHAMRGRYATMQKLIQVGLKIFSEVGFNGATTRMISQRSGVNEALIIRYFQSKSGLFLAIIENFIADAKKKEKDYQPGETVQQEIENYLLFKLHSVFSNRDFLRMCVSRIAIDSKIRKQFEQLVLRTIYTESSHLEQRMAELFTLGRIRKDVDLKKTLKVIQLLDDGIKFQILITAHFDVQEAQEQIRCFAHEFGSRLAI